MTDDLGLTLGADEARLLLRYLNRVEGYGESQDVVRNATWVREQLRDLLRGENPEMPSEIGSVVTAPLHEDDGGVAWVYAGWHDQWHHGKVTRSWDDLDVIHVDRIGTDVSDETYMTRRVKGLVSVLLESHGRRKVYPGMNVELVEAAKEHDLLMVRFLEDMLSARDPGYKPRGTRYRTKNATPIEMGANA